MALKRFPSPVTFGDVLKQAFGRFSGKEIQHGYTVMYVWMANQFGHFTLGFLITFLILWIVELSGGSLANPWGWLLAVPIGQLLAWTVKETNDYIQAVSGAPKFFPVDKGSIALDAVTAVFFIAIGLVVSYATLWGGLPPLVALFALLVIALIPGRYWLIQKLVFQQAGLPFLYRLADFPAQFPRENVERVMLFIARKGAWKHLLITGGPGTGRTSLTVGIGTEHALVLGKTRYTTLVKLLALAQKEEEPELQEGLILWPWREADLVLVDDVEIAGGPKEVENALTSLPAEAQEKLRSRRTVWVLGPSEHAEAWRDMFSRVLVVKPEDLGLLSLAVELEGSTAESRMISNLHTHLFS